MLVHGLHALEELLVERDVVGKLRQFRTDAHSDFGHLVRSVGLHEVEEYAADTAQQLSLLFERHNRVLECRLCRIVHDGVYLGPGYRNGGVEGRLIVRKFDLVERRRLVMGVPLCQQRVRRVYLRQLCLRYGVLGTCCRNCCD